MFWKKKKANEPHESRIILGMIMLRDGTSFDAESFIEDFKSHFGLKVQEPTGDNASFSFKVEGEMVAIGYLPIPIPSGDIEGTAEYAYNWQTAVEDTKEHKSHLIVSLLRGGQDQINRFKIFSQVLCSLLRTTDAIGVYKGSQSLLIPKDDYVREVELMGDDYLPINLWIYFGLRISDKGNSGYTYGLNQFGKTEVEVVDSSETLEDIRGLLFNIVYYVLKHDVTFQDGETIGGSEEEEIGISYSKGQYLEGHTFKLAY